MDKRFKILVVDDEPINIKVITAALKSEYDVFSSVSGYDAISKLKEYMPDLILLDVMMPDLNGFDVCRIIKADASFAEIPVVFLTALDSTDGETQGLELGGIDYLTKPVNMPLLKLRVHNHIELKRRSDIVREQRDLLAHQKEELEATLARVKQLEGVIPICMHCKSIRTDEASWQQIETYISDHTDALFSHGVCPFCIAEHYPAIAEHKQMTNGVSASGDAKKQ
jgi:response regulator RpfG family c-di-GMP phosphodiesterase